MAVRTARPLPPCGRQPQRRIPRPQVARQRGRAVGAAVVGHQHAIVHAPLAEKRGQLGQRPGQPLFFVVGGNDDRQIVVGRRHHNKRRRRALVGFAIAHENSPALLMGGSPPSLKSGLMRGTILDSANGVNANSPPLPEGDIARSSLYLEEGKGEGRPRNRSTLSNRHTTTSSSPRIAAKVAKP